MPELTVVVMAYNEVASVRTVAEELHGELLTLDRPFELLIVDDGSSDGTGLVADDFARERSGVRVVHHGVNCGLGGVYRTGFREARGSYLTFYPADGQFPATILSRMFPMMGAHDLVLGYLPDRRSSAVAKLLSWAERMLYRALFGGFPEFQGVLMLRRELLGRMNLKSSGRGWAVLMEFILRTVRMGARIVSIPTTMRPRMSGSSKVNNWRTIRANLEQAFTLNRLLRVP